MQYTKYHSLNQILEFPRMREYLTIFYSDYLLTMYPKELANEPLALLENFAKTPWEEPFSIVVDQLLDAVTVILDCTVHHKRRCIPLWNLKKQSWSLEEEKKGGKNQVFLLSPCEIDLKRKPAVIICPGGGYESVCFSGEGNPILHYMEAQGYRAFILRYRVAPNRYPEPQKDLTLAIQYLRANAKSYGIDENQIMVLGASAGGHLCALQAAEHEKIKEWVIKDLKDQGDERAKDYESISAKPNQVSLSYPVISFKSEAHEGSFLALTGGREELREQLSVERLITSDYPRTFVWTCEDDDCVPASNAKRMQQALEEKQVDSKFCLYSSGGHGCGLAFSKEAWNWSREMIHFSRK